jgi:hypothetical protein
MCPKLRQLLSKCVGLNALVGSCGGSRELAEHGDLIPIQIFAGPVGSEQSYATQTPIDRGAKDHAGKV